MIQLKRNDMSRYKWDGTFIWVNPDHITFLRPGKASYRSLEPDYTTITTIGGGRVEVHETPEEILKMMTNWVKVPT